MNIIPAIDLRGGRCVRLYQGDFDRQTEYSVDPVSLAAEYAALGLSQLHIVDLDGAQSGQQGNRDIIRNLVARSSMAVQLGGGIRERAHLDAWIDLGVARVVIGTLAIESIGKVRSWLEDLGADRIVLALDVNIDAGGTPIVATHGWTRSGEMTLWDCIDAYLASGLQHILCTDISRDGAMSGPNLALYEQLIARYPGLSIQASGGVRDRGDLHALRSIGASAAICGRALLDGEITHEEIRQFLRDA